MVAALGLALAGCFWGAGVLKGEVLDGQGHRVSGAVITVADSTVVSEDGTFAFTGLPEGRLSLRVEAPGFQPYRNSVDVVAGQAQEITVRLTPEEGPPGTPPPEPPPGEPPPEEPVAPAVLQLRVHEAFSGKRFAVARFTVTLDGQQLQGYSGAMELDNLSPGEHTLEVRSEYYWAQTIRLNLQSGANSRTVELYPVFPVGDVWALAQLVRAEADGEPYTGQVAVAASVLNRVESPRYPDTLAGVIYDTSWGVIQYEPVANGTINVPPDDDALAATADALAGIDPSGGATGFYNPDKTNDGWVSQQPKTVKIGNHQFFV